MWRVSRVVPPRSRARSSSARASRPAARDSPSTIRPTRIRILILFTRIPACAKADYAAVMAKKLTLEEHADQIRAELKVPHQSAVFAHAVEAGYLTARADGEVDTNEREVLAKAV